MHQTMAVCRLLFFALLLVFTGCASRPTPPPPEAVNALPFGAVDLNISKSGSPFYLRDSLGASLRYKALHAKTIVIDDAYFVIGSVNMDPRSRQLNTELVSIIKRPNLRVFLPFLY